MLKSVTLLFTTLSLLVLAVGSSVQADISLARIFSDHMVLQQNSSVKVWGAAEPEDKLVIKFDGQTVKATADSKGRWSTAIRTPDAGGPYELEVAVEAGEPKIVISDVMIGEVWICSGQSNMEWPIAKSLNAETEIEQSQKFPNIRLFTVEHHTSAKALNDFSKGTHWDCCSPDTVKEFSAVAFFFARELSKKLDIPIGLINSSWGGTRCEAWTSRAAMEDVAELAPLLRQWDENEDLTGNQRPANLFNAMISPLAGFSFRGVIWYQGEANVGRGHQYQALFPTMIESWRTELNSGEFPFYFVQLAPFRYNGRSSEALPELWDAQFKTWRSVANTGMVVTTDVGNPKDIHPKNKQAVGRRLALWALSGTYDDLLPVEEKIGECSGPEFESHSIIDDKVRVIFRHAKGGLVSEDNESPTHFTVCGEDKVFHPATAEIDGEAVILSSPEVSKPKAVRFAWDDIAKPNLFNQHGLPTSPFRTDDFDLQSKDVKF